jgi:uncharacterized protein YerC
MKIAKVSRYVPVITGTSGGREGSGGTTRSMLISLPLLNFLEKDRDNTEYYHRYKPMDDIPTTHNTTYSQAWIDRVKVEPMTEREVQIEKMLNDGMSYREIAEKIGLSKGAIPGYVHKIRAKRAYITLQTSNAQTTD